MHSPKITHSSEYKEETKHKDTSQLSLPPEILLQNLQNRLSSTDTSDLESNPELSREISNLLLLWNQKVPREFVKYDEKILSVYNLYRSFSQTLSLSDPAGHTNYSDMFQNDVRRLKLEIIDLVNEKIDPLLGEGVYVSNDVTEQNFHLEIQSKLKIELPYMDNQITGGRILLEKGKLLIVDDNEGIIYTFDPCDFPIESIYDTIYNILINVNEMSPYPSISPSPSTEKDETLSNYKEVKLSSDTSAKSRPTKRKFDTDE